jgi:hypothetical protein
MRTTLRLLVAVALLAPALARAQASASVQLQLGLPVVLPPMVVVQPGVQVVPDVDEEVFFCNGWYWVRRDGGWYRSHDHRHGWHYVHGDRVPRRLVALPPGHYRRWHPPPHGSRPMPARYRQAPPRHEAVHGGHGPAHRQPPRAEPHHGKDRHDHGRW